MEERYRNVQVNPMVEEISKLTPEEKLAWDQCLQTEGRWKGGYGGALVGSMMGFWCARLINMHKRMGIIVFCSGTLGYLYGKLMYAGICLNKAAPQVKENLQRIYSTRGNQTQYTQQPISAEASQPIHTDDSTPSIYFDEPLSNYDAHAHFTDYSDLPTNVEPEVPVTQQKNVSYDELRKKNRDEYMQSIIQRPATSTAAQPPPTHYSTVRKPNTENRTKYGDVWD
ncbi:hypothetical protein KM043_010555 [Ampulex compressa]|nr:hypothetical protein KM043_010555 [Ampulex compressa]